MTARRPAKPTARKAPTIRIMGEETDVEAAIARLQAVGFREIGRASMRGVPDGLRVYGVLSDQPAD